MGRDRGISATKPIFPSFLLPSFSLPFQQRRRQSEGSEGTAPSLSTSPASTANTTPASSPPKDGLSTTHDGRRGSRRLSRIASDTIRCSTCAADIAFASQIVSKGFTGRHGRAFLVSSPSVSDHRQRQKAALTVPGEDPTSLLNVCIGRSESRQLVTGWHVVADITCSTCRVKLGWKYVDAMESDQKYKVGKYILEKERVVEHRHWEDVAVMVHDDSADELDEDDLGPTRMSGDTKYQAHRSAGATGDWDIEFDSEDEEECEAVFAGTWDREMVAKRRHDRGM